MRVKVLIAVMALAAFAAAGCQSTTYNFHPSSIRITNAPPLSASDEVEGQIATEKFVELPDGSVVRTTGGGQAGSQSVSLYIGSTADNRPQTEAGVSAAATMNSPGSTTASTTERDEGDAATTVPAPAPAPPTEE